MFRDFELDFEPQPHKILNKNAYAKIPSHMQFAAPQNSNSFLLLFCKA